MNIIIDIPKTVIDSTKLIEIIRILRETKTEVNFAHHLKNKQMKFSIAVNVSRCYSEGRIDVFCFEIRVFLSLLFSSERSACCTTKATKN